MHSLSSHGSSRKRLSLALSLGILYFIILAVGSFYSDSLSLMANAGHMLIHNGALIIGIIATSFAMKKPNEKFSAGYNKIEAIGSYTNGLLLIIVAVFVFNEAFNIFESHGHEEHNIDASIAGVVAIIGLVIHLISSIILYSGKNDNLCVNAAFYHIFFDILSTISTLFVAIYVYFTNDSRADTVVATIIGFLILFNALRIIKESILTLLDGTPEHIKYNDIVKTLKKVPHIVDVHNLIIRRKGSKEIELSSHLVMHHNCLHAHHWNDCRVEAEKILKKEFNIDYCILQLESENICNHKKKEKV